MSLTLSSPSQLPPSSLVTPVANSRRTQQAPVVVRGPHHPSNALPSSPVGQATKTSRSPSARPVVSDLPSPQGQGAFRPSPSAPRPSQQTGVRPSPQSIFRVSPPTGLRPSPSPQAISRLSPHPQPGSRVSPLSSQAGARPSATQPAQSAQPALSALPAQPVSPGDADLDYALRLSMMDDPNGGGDIDIARVMQEQEEQLARLRLAGFLRDAQRARAQQLAAAAEEAARLAAEQPEDNAQAAQAQPQAQAQLQQPEEEDDDSSLYPAAFRQLLNAEQLQHLEAMIAAGFVDREELQQVAAAIMNQSQGGEVQEGEGEGEGDGEGELERSIDPDRMSYEELLELEARIGQVKHPGANMELVEQLPAYKYSPSKEECRIVVVNGRSGRVRPDQSCAICITSYEQGEELRVLPCFHAFHKDCISKWLSERNACPQCRLKPTDT